jgi:high-affinity Fe2+/Pb2+ permease
MLAEAIHNSAGMGVGTFLGVLVVLWLMKRSGRDVQLLKGSVLFTALVAGMSAWMLGALVTGLVG